jgi:hypothetical protein
MSGEIQSVSLHLLQDTVALRTESKRLHRTCEIKPVHYFKQLLSRLGGADPVASVHAGSHKQIPVASQQDASFLRNHSFELGIGGLVPIQRIETSHPQIGSQPSKMNIYT